MTDKTLEAKIMSRVTADWLESILKVLVDKADGNFEAASAIDKISSAIDDLRSGGE